MRPYRFDGSRRTSADYLEDAVKGVEQPYNDICYTMTLSILVLFFLAVVSKAKT